MNINVALTVLQVLGFEVFPLVGVRDWKDFETKQRKGTIYTVLNRTNCLEPIQIKVPDQQAIIDQETLDKHNAAMQLVHCRCEGFEGKPYVDKGGRMAISCNAQRIMLADKSDKA